MRRLRFFVVMLGSFSACSASPFKPYSPPSPSDLGSLDTASDVAEPGDCEFVTLSFEGIVSTVSDHPLNLDDSARSSAVSGSFSYAPCTMDLLPADPLRGNYDGDGAFSLSVATHTITGSGNPFVQVENLNPDTFQFEDGHRLLDPKPRTMNVDGKPSASLGVLLAITDESGAAFTSDALPKIFPLLDVAHLPHTFSVQDSNGTLLLQLGSLTQQ